jgi:hypothetical protein
VGDISSAGTGLVVGGVGTLLLATFGVALRMFILSDRKDDASYARLLEELADARRHVEAQRARHAEAMAAASERHARAIEELKAEASMWRDRYLSEREAHP